MCVCEDQRNCVVTLKFMSSATKTQVQDAILVKKSGRVKETVMVVLTTMMMHNGAAGKKSVGSCQGHDWKKQVT